MEGLRSKKYLLTMRKRFDPVALFLSVTGIAAILFSVVKVDAAHQLFDLQSAIIVLGGTASILLFQFDLSVCLSSLRYIFASFTGTPEKPTLKVMAKLDQAIVDGRRLYDLREGAKLTGEILNDVVYMHRQGLVYAEIDAFITARIQDSYNGRATAAVLLARGAMLAPALGLFGTVMGLVGVLRSLANPAELGPSMALALMTTAYGAILGTIIFTPLQGRLEHHNQVYLEVHKQLLAKVGILLDREERSLPLQYREAI